MFCEFIEIDTDTYQCVKCNNVIVSTDFEPPIFPCGMQINTNNPNWIEKIKNFTSSAFDHLKNGLEYASDDEIKKRFDICQTCEFYKNGTCSQCGCPIYRTRNYISKLSWASEKCPIEKW